MEGPSEEQFLKLNPSVDVHLCELQACVRQSKSEVWEYLWLDKCEMSRLKKKADLFSFFWVRPGPGVLYSLSLRGPPWSALFSLLRDLVRPVPGTRVPLFQYYPFGFGVCWPKHLWR